MQSQIEHQGLRQFEMHRFTQLGTDQVIGATEWVDADGVRHERYAVLTIREDKIADMQVCGTWRQAKRFARRDVANPLAERARGA